jgi:hypothetical protein
MTSPMCIDPSSISKYWSLTDSEPTATEGAKESSSEAAPKEDSSSQCADKVTNAILSCSGAVIGGVLAARAAALLPLVGAAVAGFKCAKDIGDADTACRE